MNMYVKSPVFPLSGGFYTLERSHNPKKSGFYARAFLPIANDKSCDEPILKKELRIDDFIFCGEPLALWGAYELGKQHMEVCRFYKATSEEEYKEKRENIEDKIIADFRRLEDYLLGRKQLQKKLDFVDSELDQALEGIEYVRHELDREKNNIIAILDKAKQYIIDALDNVMS